MNTGKARERKRAMSILCRRFARFFVDCVAFRKWAAVTVLVLAAAAILWGQILSKEYIHLNGRTVAIDVPPAVVTMLNVPAGGSYPIHTTQQTISFRVDGAGGINEITFTVDNLFSSTDACFASYFPASNTFYFYSFDGTPAAYTIGPGASPPSVSNYHCTLDLLNSSITSTPTSVTMNLPVTLQPSSVGMQNIYVLATSLNYYYAINSFTPRASWLAFDELSTAPPTYSLLGTLTSANSQTVYFKFSDLNGFRYIDQQAQVMLAYDAFGNSSPCYLSFTPALRSGTLYSYASGVGTYIGSGNLGLPGSISGSSCSIPELASSKVHFDPDPAKPDPNPNASVVTDMYLDLVLSLGATVTHPLGVYAGDLDRSGRGQYAYPPSTSAFQVGTWP